MVKFETNGKSQIKTINLPSKLSEITSEYLKWVTEEVVIAENYSIVALCYKEKLSSFILAGKNKKQISTAVVPLFVKGTNVKLNNSVEVATGDKLIVSPSQLALGHHVNVFRNNLTMGTILNTIEGDGYAYQRASSITEEVYFIEYKIIPNCDIIGFYSSNKLDNSFENPFEIEVFDV